MPAIPTILSERDIYTGSTGPQARPDQFGPDLTDLGQGLKQLGQGVDQAAHAMGIIEKHKKAAEDSKWATQSIMQERMNLQEWMSKPENNGSDEFSNSFKKYATERIAAYDKAAPSPEAADFFHAHMGDFVARQYEVALHTTEKNRLNNGILAIDQSISDSLKSFRDAQGTPNSNALVDLEDNLHLIHDGIEAQFGKVSPVTASKLEEHLVKQAVMGIMDSNPQDAKRILGNSNVVDEETRRTLNNMIEQSQKSRDIVAEDQFSRTRKDLLVDTFAGNSTKKIPLDSYELFYDKQHAQVYKAHDDALIDTYVRANTLATDIAGKNPQAQIKALTDLSSSMHTEQDRATLEIMQPKIRRNLELMGKNRVGWMMENNPTVRGLSKQVQEAATDDQRNALSIQLNDAILAFQGNPGTDTKNADYYLNLPSHDRHLLTSTSATGTAADINKSDPADAIRKIQQIIATYPDANHQSVVFNDLVNLPEKGSGIKQEYQLAFQNKDAWWIDNYVAALANTQGIAKLDDDTRKNIFKEIESNPTWKAFQASMVGDDFSRVKEIEGFKTGILAYSHTLSMNGKPLKEAARTAVNSLIGESLGFTQVNGQYLAITKEKNDKQRRTDEDVIDIGRRLGVALKDIDPREINDQHFPGLKALPDEGSRGQALRNIITSRGFFVTGNDGQSASLHLRDDHGAPFEVTDKRGNALTIFFDDLPDFTYQGGRGYVPAMPGVNPNIASDDMKRKTYPSTTYDIRTGGGMLDKLFGSGQVKTNWPAMGDYIHRVPTFPVQRLPMAPPAEDSSVIQMLKQGLPDDGGQQDQQDQNRER